MRKKKIRVKKNIYITGNMNENRNKDFKIKLSKLHIYIIPKLLVQIISYLVEKF